MDRLKVAVVGATGLVGRELIRLLDDHPFFDLEAIYASQSSIGTIIPVSKKGHKLEVKHAEAEEISRRHFDFVFSAVSEQSAALLERELMQNGNRIITNASGNRMLPDVPIVVPEINFNEIAKLHHNYIIANGNCSTIGLVLALAPLVKFGIRSVNVTTLQAVSGAGYAGTPSMDILSNVIPYIPGEEEKMVAETHKILDPYNKRNFQLTATCTRVPVINGHLESVTVNLGSEVSLNDIVDSFSTFRNTDLPRDLPTLPDKPIIFHDEKDRPQPRLDSMNQGKLQGMQVSVGRARISGGILQFVLVIDNLIRGAAGSTLLNAEVAARIGGYI
ncbi:MAG: aspartate-semialdehyde dehydrogenase [Candidatus Thermoplasmatota archaeon]|nr:aspartate-semialdehyde dehydrogenase [Candidatus Thermoplasmatota archaeon]